VRTPEPQTRQRPSSLSIDFTPSPESARQLQFPPEDIQGPHTCPNASRSENTLTISRFRASSDFVCPSVTLKSPLSSVQPCVMRRLSEGCQTWGGHPDSPLALDGIFFDAGLRPLDLQPPAPERSLTSPGASRQALMRTLSELSFVTQELSTTTTPTPRASSMSHASAPPVFNWQGCEETLFIFDWDDTLCPTTFISSDDRVNYRDRCACFDKDPSMLLDPKDGSRGLLSDALSRHEAAVKDVLQAATSSGTVVIVTLAQEGWIDTSIENFLPGLKGFIEDLDIEFVYARQALSSWQLRAAMHDDMDVWKLLKTKAMEAVITRFYSRTKRRSWKNIISIGDSIVERDALVEVTFTHSQCDKHGQEKPLRCKTVKLEDEPDLAQLTEELQVLQNWIKPLGFYDGTLSIDLGCSEEAVAALRTLLSSSPSPRRARTITGTSLDEDGDQERDVLE